MNNMTIESYNRTACEYEKHTGKISTETKSDGFLQKLKPNAEILDVGCGPGHDAQYFHDKGHSITGIDLSEEMIKLAKERVPEGDFRVMDIENLDFQSGQFDAIWASAALLHIPRRDIPDVLANFKKILKNEGYLYVSLKEGKGEGSMSDKRYGGVLKFWSYYQEDEIHKLLENAGFSIKESRIHEKSSDYQTHPWISVIAQSN